jgi:hypothetical protein
MEQLLISSYYNCNQLVMQARTDGSARCYYNVGTGLSTRQLVMRTRTVQKASTNSITKEDDGFPPPWPTSWTCSRTISELSKSTTISPCLTSRIRWVLYEIRSYRCGEIVDWGSSQNFERCDSVVFNEEIFSLGVYLGHAIAQAVSRWLPIAAARVQTRV